MNIPGFSVIQKWWYVGRLSKKSKNGDFSNSACNEISNLQVL